jgi:tRNA pseudouridine38-40 synthase
MSRYKLLIEYDGTPYVGWQRQANGRAVQQAVEEAIEAFCGEAPRLQGAGRTDAGVHATGQVASVTLARDWPTGRMRDALNAQLTLLDECIAILSVERVADTFDARFSAKRRRYLYRIVDRLPPLALERRRAWHCRKALDAEAMHGAAQCLVGHHDFTTFRSADCQSESPLKTLARLDVLRVGDEVQIVAAARSFLHNQVRSMVGSLRRVGDGSWSADDLVVALEARSRACCAALAPPHGLYLTGIDY